MSILYLSGPAIDVQPSDVNVEAGGTATFTVEASGEGLRYQWFDPDGEALNDSDGEIEGSASRTLTVFNAERGVAGDYTVVVTNSAGSVTSDAATLSIGEIKTCLLLRFMYNFYFCACRFQVKLL